MIMTKFFNKKGYTLTYAIIIIGLLLIITSSVIFVSYYNLKTARIGGHINTSFYANDGALEEAITELNQYVYNAEVVAWDRIDKHNFITSDPTWVNFLSHIYSDINSGTPGFSIEKGNELIALALKGEFEKTFFNELYSANQANHAFYNPSGINLEDRYLDYNGYTGVSLSTTPTLKPAMITKFEANSFNATNIVTPSDKKDILVSNFTLIDEQADGSLIPGTNGFTLRFTTDGTYHDYQKSLEVDLHVIAPDYAFSVAMLTENIAMYRNDITNYALVANSNLVVFDGPTVVNGDAYALGDYLNADQSVRGHVDVNYNLNRNHYGGVVVGYRDAAGGETRIYSDAVIDNFNDGASTPYSSDAIGNLRINGSLATRNSVKIETGYDDGGTPKGSTLTVTDDIYANAMYVRPGTSYADINVFDNLYLYADLFISGTDTSVTVGTTDPPTINNPDTSYRIDYRPDSGVIYGLHDANYAVGDLYTRTGSIIISSTASNPIVNTNGLMLSGVIRYDVEGTGSLRPGDTAISSYKTGESFTTFNNAQYYQSQLTDDIYSTGVFSYLSKFGKGGIVYDLISFSTSDGDPTVLDQIDYRANHFFTMGYYASVDTENIYKDIPNTDKSVIRIRNGHDNTDDEFYGIQAKGLVAFSNIDGSNGKVYNTNRTAYRFTQVDQILQDDTSDPVDEAVDKKINLLGFTDTDNSDSSNFIEANLFSSWLDVVINDETADASDDVVRPSIPLSSMDATSFGIYNNDASKNIYINFPDSYYSGGNPIDPNHIYIKGVSNVTENLEGTIVTRGNVYIYAASGETLNYTGNIISEKNIYIFGPGTKNFNYNEQLIYETINNNKGGSGDYDGLVGLYGTENGRKLNSIQGLSNSSNFELNTSTNKVDEAKITINYVSSGGPNGTNIIDSNAIVIDSWREK